MTGSDRSPAATGRTTAPAPAGAVVGAVWGPLIARQLHLQNSTINHYVPLGVLLPGMPQTFEEAVSLVNESEGWGY